MLYSLESSILSKLNGYFASKKDVENVLIIETYMGEFEDPSKIENMLNKPLIFLDFVNESYQDIATKKVDFKIYVCSRCSTKEKDKRIANKYVAIKLIEEIDKVLIDELFSYGFEANLTNLSKTYERVSEQGYISLYTRDFSVLIKTTNEGEGIEII